MSKIRHQVNQLALTTGLTFLATYVMFVYTWAGVGGALAAATVMSLLTLILGAFALGIQNQRQKAAYAGKQKARDDMSTHQTRTIEIDLPMETAFDLAQDALNILDQVPIPMTLTGIPAKQTLHIRKADCDIGRIEAGLKAKTLGIQDVMEFSKIEIQLQRIDTQTTRLQIESYPTIKSEQFDLGRHTHYVNQLALHIRQMANEQSATSRLSEHTSLSDDTSFVNTDRKHQNQQK